MAGKPNQRKAEAAWKRIEALGGHGVWDGDVVIVSLAGTKITDDELALFRDFPFVQTLDLSHTNIGGSGLSHLEGLRALEELIVLDTKITDSALDTFRRSHPSVVITTRPKKTINPFSGNST